MIERAFLLLLLGGLVALGWYLLGRRSLNRARQAALPPEAEAALQRARSAVLYFWTTSCAQCRSLQAPALRQLEQDLGAEVAIVPIDAAANADLSAQFGIVTVPSTVIIDRSGVRSVNLGFISAAALREQLSF